MAERRIGKIISVDSFRVVVQLDSNIKSLYKNGYNDIYEIARINSYIIIPVGSERLVAIITRVKIQDETEIEKTSGSITLPKAERYLVATLLGTIESKSGRPQYIQGVYNYPILDNPVWYVVKEDLDEIFDTKEKSGVSYEDDYYLPIGISPAFSDYQVKINPDKLFGKHAAILGNTGSGKSCTVSTIIQGLFNHTYPDNKKLQSANIIIFDTNGEYKQAFTDENKKKIKVPEEMNTFYISSENLKVPYWFMNYDDFDFLFRPSELTQAPILKRSIALAKDNVSAGTQTDFLAIPVETEIENILNGDIKYFANKKYDNYAKYVKGKNFIASNEFKQLSNAINTTTGILGDIKKLLSDISLDEDFDVCLKHVAALRIKFEEYSRQKQSAVINSDRNVDLPKWFSFELLISQFIEFAIQESEGSTSRLRENLATLKLRLHAYLTDDRLSSPLLLNRSDEETVNDNFLLNKFLAFILGHFFLVPEDKLTCLFSDTFNKNGTIKKDKKNQIIIIDLSLLPFEVLETVTGLIGRIILEFTSRITKVNKQPKQRGDIPIALVLEEAQNYIPEKDRNDRVSISKKVFERIAREGRKFGVSLVISSQRPSELSKTVLSQCNSFIIHRLQNPEDQKYIRQLVSSANEDILQQLPILPQQQAIIMGDAVRTPIQVRINDASPKPDSDNPQFIQKWLEAPSFSYENFHAVARTWLEGGQKLNEPVEARNEDNQDPIDDWSDLF